MRKLLLLGSLASLSLIVLGCPKKNTGADAAADADTGDSAVAAATDAAAAPAVINAKNTADVARFPGEVPIAAEVAKTLQLATVHASPRAGATVATLKAGTDVTKMAEYQSTYLVTFPDPKDASATLMGWLAKEAFSVWVPHDAGHVVDAAAPVVDAGPPKKVNCAIGQVAVVLTPPNAVCRRKCTKDTDCKNQVAGACANATSQTGTAVRACVQD